MASFVTIPSACVPGQHLLPHTLAVFRQRQPSFRVRVVVSDAVLREVEQGHAHLGLIGERGGGPHLELRRFACDRLVLVVPKGHQWWRRSRVTLAELAAQPLIQRERAATRSPGVAVAGRSPGVAAVPGVR